MTRRAAGAAVLPARRGRRRVPVLQAAVSRRAADPHHRRGDLPVRPEPGHRDRRQARPATLARVTPGCCSAGCGSGARGTATGTTTWTRRPAAAAGTTRRAACPRSPSAAGGPAAAAGPDHPGRAAPDLRRARHHGRAVRGGRRRVVHVADARPAARPVRRSSPPRRPPNGRASRCSACSAGSWPIFPPPVIDVTDTFFSRQVPLSKPTTRAGDTSASARTGCG